MLLPVVSDVNHKDNIVRAQSIVANEYHLFPDMLMKYYFALISLLLQSGCAMQMMQYWGGTD